MAWKLEVQKHDQIWTRSQKCTMGREVFRVSVAHFPFAEDRRLENYTSIRRRQGGLVAELPALKNFVFFWQK